MKRILFILLLIPTIAASQSDLSGLLKKHNTESIPYITIDSLKTMKDQVVLLDAREKKEFDVSHLKNAQYVGYEFFDLHKTTQSLPDKDATIVVYCSLGVRSEDIAEKLKSAGYGKVFNLYGGIFEWKNTNNPVVNLKGKETSKVHAFSKEWGVWLTKGEKVY